MVALLEDLLDLGDAAGEGWLLVIREGLLDVCDPMSSSMSY